VQKKLIKAIFILLNNKQVRTNSKTQESYKIVNMLCNIMQVRLPRSITWQGHGKSRLSNVSFPDVEDIDLKEEVNEHFDMQPIYIPSSPISIRRPTSLKDYRKALPTLVVRKRSL
jgi:hypothetical protein